MIKHGCLLFIIMVPEQSGKQKKSFAFAKHTVMLPVVFFHG